MECRSPRLGRHALVIAFLILAGCTSEKKPAPKASPPAQGGVQYEELRFVADPTLLGFVYSEPSLGISIAPPRNWPVMDPDSLAKVQAMYEQLAAGDNPFVAHPVRIFYEKDRRLFMSVSALPSWPLVMSPEAAIAQYRQLVFASMPEAQMIDGFFRSGKVTGYRLLLMNELMANFRILVMHEGRPPVQINYLLPRPLFPEQQKAIEASVGSITYL
jgi:hypothetical protein